MKKWRLLVATAAISLSLAGCVEEEGANSSTTDTSNGGTQEEVVKTINKEIVAIGYGELERIKYQSADYDSDTGKFTYKTIDNQKSETNNAFTKYKFKEKSNSKKKEKMIKEFGLNYRLGTLTPDITKAPNTGYVVTIGQDNREYHVVESKDDSYDYYQVFDLINGIRVSTNDYYTIKEYKNKKQLNELIQKAEKNVSELKEEFGIEENTAVEEKSAEKATEKHEEKVTTQQVVETEKVDKTETTEDEKESVEENKKEDAVKTVDEDKEKNTKEEVETKEETETKE